MTGELSNKILASLKSHYGEVTPALNFTGLYQLTVAVVLSAQTTDIQVNRVTPELFSRYPDFKSLGTASINDVEKIVRSTGFYHNKTQHIIGLSAIISREWGGKLPPDREKLMSLPGIGRKSANVILSIGFNIPALAVDTHVTRIANRLGYESSKNPLKIEKALISFIPESEWRSAHLLFIEHGRAICDAKKPLCENCPINTLCESSCNI